MANSNKIPVHTLAFSVGAACFIVAVVSAVRGDWWWMGSYIFITCLLAALGARSWQVESKRREILRNVFPDRPVNVQPEEPRQQQYPRRRNQRDEG